MLNEIINYTNIKEPFKRVIFREIKIPIVSSSYDAVDKNYFRYPPMLVPLFADYDLPDIIGIAMHPFSSRQSSFVRFNLAEGYFREIALNSTQLETQMILKMIMIEEEITEDISNFCNEIRFQDLEKVDLFSDQYGDNYIHFDKLVNFQNNCPLHYCQTLENYNGNFLSSDKLINLKAIDDSSTFELSDKIFLEENTSYPIWFKNDNLISIFYKFLDQKKFREAWLCLNSGTWTKKDLSKGLLDLKDNTTDVLFNLLCYYWLDNNSGSKD